MDHKDFLRLIDDFIDGELSPETEAEMRKHASICSVCAEELNAAIVVRDVLKGMDDDIPVPLEAEAAWKRAINTECKRRKMHRFYRVASGIAAVFILIIGINYYTKTGSSDNTVHRDKSINISQTSADSDSASEMTFSTESAVLSDGVSKETQSAKYDAERKYETADYSGALDTIRELAEEYEADISINENSEEPASAEISVTITGENSQAFLDAISHIGTETVNITGDLSGDTVTIGITIIQA